MTPVDPATDGVVAPLHSGPARQRDIESCRPLLPGREATGEKGGG